MLVDVVSVRALEGHKLEIEFEDGTRGVVDVGELVEFRGVFETLQDESYFKEVFVNDGLGVVSWPNGADLDTDVLYSLVLGEEVPKFEMMGFASS